MTRQGRNAITCTATEARMKEQAQIHRERDENLLRRESYKKGKEKSIGERHKVYY